jgi:hypothetical protein
VLDRSAAIIATVELPSLHQIVEEADTELVLVEARHKLMVETNVASNPRCHSQQHVTIEGEPDLAVRERERLHRHHRPHALEPLSPSLSEHLDLAPAEVT